MITIGTERKRHFLTFSKFFALLALLLTLGAPGNLGNGTVTYAYTEKGGST